MQVKRRVSVLPAYGYSEVDKNQAFRVSNPFETILLYTEEYTYTWVDRAIISQHVKTYFIIFRNIILYNTRNS